MLNVYLEFSDGTPGGMVFNEDLLLDSLVYQRAIFQTSS